MIGCAVTFVVFMVGAAGIGMIRSSLGVKTDTGWNGCNIIALILATVAWIGFNQKFFS